MHNAKVAEHPEGSAHGKGASRRSHCTASAPAGGAGATSAGSGGTGRQHSALYLGSWSLQARHSVEHLRC